jgi:hypothetical protein
MAPTWQGHHKLFPCFTSWVKGCQRMWSLTHPLFVGYFIDGCRRCNPNNQHMCKVNPKDGAIPKTKGLIQRYKGNSSQNGLHIRCHPNTIRNLCEWFCFIVVTTWCKDGSHLQAKVVLLPNYSNYTHNASLWFQNHCNVTSDVATIAFFITFWQGYYCHVGLWHPTNKYK